MQQPAPQMTASRRCTAQAPSPQMPRAAGAGRAAAGAHHRSAACRARRRAPSLFEKVTSRLTGQQTPKAPPAPQAPPPAGRAAESEPVMSQPQLQLDPADRMSLSRQEEDMLDIPAFLRFGRPIDGVT